MIHCRITLLVCSFFYLSLLMPHLAQAEDAPAASIGAILPLTGDATYWGENPRKAITLALQDLSTEGITPPKIIFEDERCDSKAAVAAFHKLVERDKVTVILGPACSSSTLAVAPLAEAKGILLLPFSESSLISTGKQVILLWVPNHLQGVRLAQYAYHNRSFRRIGILSIQNGYGVTLSKSFKEEFVRLGGKIVGLEEYSPQDTTLREQLIRISSKKPEALFLSSYYPDGSILVREAHALQLKLPLLGASTLDAPEFYAATKEMSEGLTFANIPETTSPQFISRWETHFSSKYPGMSSGASLFYDMILIIGRWLKNNTLSPIKLRTHLLPLSFTEGMSGGISFTHDGYLNRVHEIYTINERKAVKNKNE